MALSVKVKSTGQWIKVGEMKIFVHNQQPGIIQVLFVGPREIQVDRKTEPPPGYEDKAPQSE